MIKQLERYVEILKKAICVTEELLDIAAQRDDIIAMTQQKTVIRVYSLVVTELNQILKNSEESNA
jgi:hypothetical protein